MYDENENKELHEQGTPDDYSTQAHTPNFVMRNSEDSEQNWTENCQQNQAPRQAGSYDRQAPKDRQTDSQWPDSYRQTQQNQTFDNSSQQRWEHPPYTNQRYEEQYGQNPQQNPGPSKKKTLASKGRKAAGIAAAALLFGVISGGTMVGINMIADSAKKENGQAMASIEIPEESTEVSIADSVPETTASAVPALAVDVSDIVEQAMPSVVAINNTMMYQSNTWFGMNQTYEVPSSGSGIIVGENDDELLIVTNNHVVEGSKDLSVAFIDNTSINAVIKGTDSESDLAVITVPLKDIPETTLSQISVAKLGSSDELKLGQGVIAIGNALGLGQSVTVGYISALDRVVETEDSVTRNLLQTDAAINPGNSGGALLNMKGEVIGINAAKYSDTKVEGIGYAIPISKAQDIINSLMTKRTEYVEDGKEGYLGIQGLTVDDSMVKQLDMPAGIFVYGIIDGGAASKSDLREKDIITKFDGLNVRTMAALQDLLKCYKEGETIDLVVQSLENGQYVERTVSITLGPKTSLEKETQASK